jgi:hypothetical protein
MTRDPEDLVETISPGYLSTNGVTPICFFCYEKHFGVIDGVCLKLLRHCNGLSSHLSF